MAIVVRFPRSLNEREALDLGCHLASRGGAPFPCQATPPTPRHVDDGERQVEWTSGERQITIIKKRIQGVDHGEYPGSFDVLITGVTPPATLRMSGLENVWSRKEDRFECDGICISEAVSPTEEAIWKAEVEAWFAKRSEC